jgi:quercetin dioxygenase-like cupin family protein
MSYQIVNARDLEARLGILRAVGRELGVTAFGISHIELPPGGQNLLHDHSSDGQEEVYAVIQGQGRIRVGGQEHELSPGDFVFVSPDEQRQLAAGPEGAVWIAVGGTGASA